jgi:hypothetical protein
MWQRCMTVSKQLSTISNRKKLVFEEMDPQNEQFRHIGRFSKNSQIENEN